MHFVFVDGSLKWKKSLGYEIWTSPALQDGGRVVFMGTMAEDEDSFFALDGNSGDILWKKNLGPLFSSPSVSSDNQARFVLFSEKTFSVNAFCIELYRPGTEKLSEK